MPYTFRYRLSLILFVINVVLYVFGPEEVLEIALIFAILNGLNVVFFSYLRDKVNEETSKDDRNLK